jgi:hypothetical protein
MKTVEIPVPADDISTPMGNMRQWLDQKQLEPSIFIIDRTVGRMVVRVSFSVAEQAAAFAKNFAGRVL